MFPMKICDICVISAQSIDCVCSLELSNRGGSISTHNLCFETDIKRNNLCPGKPHISLNKVGFTRVSIACYCYYYNYYHYYLYLFHYKNYHYQFQLKKKLFRKIPAIYMGYL